MKDRWVALACVFGFLSVAFGAFGAHALRGSLSTEMLAIYQTAVSYQMAHALALLVFGIWRAQATRRSKLGELTGWAFGLGVVFFSGSLYLLALTGTRAWGAVTPVGGLFFLVGWASWLRLAFRATG